MSHHRIRVLALAVGSAALLIASGARAQRPRRAEAPQPAPQARIEPYQVRGSATYGVPPGYRGIITSTTPNESGNLGGPGTGGGSGAGK